MGSRPFIVIVTFLSVVFILGDTDTTVPDTIVPVELVVLHRANTTRLAPVEPTSPSALLLTIFQFDLNMLGCQLHKKPIC